MQTIINASKLKQTLKLSLESGNLEDAKILLSEYEKKFPYDFELFSIKSFYYFNIGELNKALSIAKKGLEINEYSDELLLNYAIINLNKKDYSEALLTLLRLNLFSSDENIKSLSINLFEENKIYLSQSDIDFINEEIKLYANDPLAYPTVKDKNVTGDIFDENYFSGVFDNHSPLRNGLFIEDVNADFISESQSLFISDIIKVNPNMNSINETATKDYILPLVSSGTLEYKFKINNEIFSKLLLKNRTYFFNVHKNDNLIIPSSPTLHIGDKIYKNNKPKLLLNIFIDGLSQKFIEDYGIQNLMPSTYNFFKEGTIFNNCYVSGEWTYVSLASMFTGKYTHNHRVFHPDKVSYSLYNQTTYPEILKSNGFYNSKIDGDWRSNPNYGYLKGLDRYLYCFGRFRMQANETVMNAIEHLETFKDTNQSLWVCLPDLHDIADEYENYTSIQSSIDVIDTKTNLTKETSVQKGYSTQKCNLYRHAIRRLDTYTSILLNYVTSNYSEEDYVINLISDHGQGYLSNDSAEFLNEYRIKVPFMTRGFGIPKCVSDELVQGLDIFKVCTNAFNNSKDNTDNIDSNLPKTLGGKEERTYVFTESIFPERSYKACFTNKDIKVFFETYYPVTQDGRIDISSLTVKVTDKNDNLLDSSKYTDLIKFYEYELFTKIKHIIII